MRVQILFLLIGAVLTATNLIATGIECPEQQLADVNRICIRPDFIEGCEDYKDAKTCDKCAKGTQSTI